MKYRMRLCAAHFARMRELLGDDTKEQACFLVVSPATGDDETVLLVRDVVPLVSTDFRVHAFDQISLEPLAMARAAKVARQMNGGVCMVHTHPMSNGLVGFSEADDHGNVETFAFFERMRPKMGNSCLVWDGPLQHAAGRIYTSAEEWFPIHEILIVDDERFIQIKDRRENGALTAAKFHRQAQMLGTLGQQQLTKRRVAIVGCGGVGSMVGVALAHAGFRDFDLIDFDHISETNLPRVIGATAEDVRNGRKKVDILRDYIKRHDATASVRTHVLQVESKELLKTLVSSDLIVCTTDDTTSRAHLNQICHQYLAPVLELGVQFAVDSKTGVLVKEIGRVHLMLPGSTCMSCTGHLPALILEQEGLTDEQSAIRKAEGYFQGAEVDEPSTMIFNMQVAGLGVQRIVEWLTGIAPVRRDEYDQFRFFGLNAAPGIGRMRKRSDPACPFCGSSRHFFGKGDNEEMLTRPRPLSFVGDAAREVEMS